VGAKTSRITSTGSDRAEKNGQPGPWAHAPIPISDYSSYVEPARAAVAHVAARYRLTASDAQDLHGDLWVRLLANQGRVVRDFRRSCRIDTYLTTIATHLLFDSRRRNGGKWSPTARALRLGAGAMELERLIARDGLSPDVALERVASRRPDSERPSLEDLARSILPKPRMSEVGPDALAVVPSSEPSPFDVACSREAARSARSLAEALRTALACLSYADRDLVISRYVDGQTVANLASGYGLDQKALYRHFDRLTQGLKASLEAAGFDRSAVSETLAGGWEIGCGRLREPERPRLVRVLDKRPSDVPRSSPPQRAAGWLRLVKRSSGVDRAQPTPM
jgi:RNA polymerase sigma factor (sigma-70 family)